MPEARKKNKKNKKKKNAQRSRNRKKLLGTVLFLTNKTEKVVNETFHNTLTLFLVWNIFFSTLS